MAIAKMMAMELLDAARVEKMMPGQGGGSQLTMTAPRVELVGVSAAGISSSESSFDLHKKTTIFEPLKVCLDDDSSIEDSDDEDMFDDDAFTFGDEDFQTLMSNMKKSQISPDRSSLASAATPSSNTHSPLHQSASIDSTDKAVESLPSTAASSQTSLGTLTINTSYASCSSLSRKTRSKRRVSLHNDVAVIPIPMRTEYPSMVRERMWSSASELSQNAARNTLEFAAEGFNWRNVADDEQMVHSPSGERIHPIHYMNLSNLSCSALNNCRQETPSQAGVSSISISMDTEPLSP